MSRVAGVKPVHYGLRQGRFGRACCYGDRLTMSDLLMRGRILRIMAVGLQPLLQRRRHALDPVERLQPGNEAGLTSI